MRSKYDDIFASMDPKEAAEFTRGDPERIKYMREVKANKKNMNDHIVDTLNKYEDGPSIQQQVINNSPKKIPTKTKNKPDVLRNILIEEMKSRDLDSDEIKYLMATKDRSTLNSQKISNTDQRILTKQNKPGAKVTPKYPKQATPEQYGKLAEKLERQRQMTGAKSKPLTAINKSPKQLELKLEFPKLDHARLQSISNVPDPETMRLEKRFKEIVQQKKDEDLKNTTMGLASFIGAKKYD